MTCKEALLLALEQGRGGDLSGQALAQMLGVSRNAVWKAVEALRREGYEIRSAPRRGYRLAEGCDPVFAAGITAALPERYRTLPIRCYDVIDSTNSEAKRLLADGLRGEALIVAGTQTGGRGRRGRSFYSPPGTGVYMTLLLQPRAQAADLVSLTAAAAVAVVRAVEGLTDRRPQIKWVNDVYLDGRKICGILTEAVTDLEGGTVESIAVGIGVNVSTRDFPDEIADVAGALGGAPLQRNRLIAGIAEAFLDIAENPADKSYLDDYRSHSMVVGRRVTVLQNDGRFAATAVGIDASGGLIVRMDDGGETTLRSGEITLRVQADTGGKA